MSWCVIAVSITTFLSNIITSGGQLVDAYILTFEFYASSDITAIWNQCKGTTFSNSYAYNKDYTGFNDYQPFSGRYYFVSVLAKQNTAIGVVHSDRSCVCTVNFKWWTRYDGYYDNVLFNLTYIAHSSSTETGMLSIDVICV